MLPGDFEFMARKARQQELLDEAEREVLIQLAQQQQAQHAGVHRKAAGWLGQQMVKWGSKLENYGGSSVPGLLKEG